MKRLLTLLLGLCCVSTSILAQPSFTVSGVVKDVNFNTVANVAVLLETTTCSEQARVDTVFTNPNGFYQLEYFECIMGQIVATADCRDGAFTISHNLVDNEVEAELNFNCGNDGTTCLVDFSHFREMNPDGTPSNRVRFEAFGSAGTVYTYNWILGDGGTSTSEVYVHEFDGPGTYGVCLLAYYSNGNQCEVCHDVVIEDRPSCGVDFTHFREIRPDGTQSDYVNFEAFRDENTDHLYAWDFGDNSEGAYDRVTSHKFENDGTYKVCVKVYTATEEFLCEICHDVVIGDDRPSCIDESLRDTSAICPDVFQPVCGCDGETYANACEAQANGLTHWTEGLCPGEQCEVDFQYTRVDDAAGTAGYIMQYAASTSRDAEFTYKWYFGDGEKAEGATVTHAYREAGFYVVCVEAYYNGEYLCTICKDIVIDDNETRECIEVDRIDNTVLCTEEYAPVCGCDGQTYANACIAENQFGVTSWTAGECPPRECPIDFTFENELLNDGTPSNKLRFSAGSSDGVTYVYRWSFGDGTFGAGDTVEREYVERRTYTICVDAYSNETFVCTVCKDIVIDDDSELCYNETLIDPNFACTEEYKPVCGCDGVTYENVCIAERRYGISRWKEGPCEQRGCQIAFAFRPDSISTDSLMHNFYFDAWTLDGHSDEYEYRWSFGDGQEAIGQVIRHGYTASGSYMVCVEAWKDGEYICSWCNEVIIHDEPTTDPDDEACRLAFGYYPDGRTDTGAWRYKFDAWTLDGKSDSYFYRWSFGDGQGSDGQSLSHDYTAGDIYYVCVEAYEGDRFVCSWCSEVRVGDEENDCQIGFEAFRDEGDATDAYHWYKLEARTPDGSLDRYTFKWQLGDGRTGVGNAIRHNYTAGGVYKICLEAYVDNELVCTWCEEILIDDTPDEGCRLAFAYSPNDATSFNGIPGFDFKAWTQDGYGDHYDYRWDFGDGRFGVGRETLHQYNTPGVYKVCAGAFTDDYAVCHWCTEVVVNEIPNEGCQIAFGYYPDTSSTAAAGKLNYAFDVWTLDGNGDRYSYKWDFGDGQTGTGMSIRNAYAEPGGFKVCVDAYDGERFVCSWCSEVRVDEELEDEDCQISFYYIEEEPTEGKQAFKFAVENFSDSEDSYTYKWSFGNGKTSEGRINITEYTEEGLYVVCVDAYKGDELVCSWCEDIKVERIPDWLPCDLNVEFAKDELDVKLKVTDAYSKYYWDFGDGSTANERSVSHTYEEAGSYFICLEVVDREGNHCSLCEMITVRKEEVFDDPCIDESKIDFDLDCSEEEKPVCGCDGVSYRNPCVAENYYGVKEWKEGPCDGVEPGDSLVICDVKFEYSVFKVNDTTYLIEFFVDEADDAYYFWDFGDGESSTEQHPLHFYSVTAGEDFSMTACLYILQENEMAALGELPYCVGTFCETLAIDESQDAFIEGTITSGGEGFRGKVERRSGGGEPLASVKVVLIDVLGQVVGQDVTDDDGNYSFENLLFGNYNVQVKIDGLEHEPYAIKLDPLNQDEEDLDFEVTEEAVTTGVEDQTFAKSINLYPNPTQGAVQLEFDLKEATQLQIKVMNLFGQTLQVQEVNFNAGTQKMDLDLRAYASGIYMISLSTPTESFSRRVVRQE